MQDYIIVLLSASESASTIDVDDIQLTDTIKSVTRGLLDGSVY
jgi:hypothetical protein